MVYDWRVPVEFFLLEFLQSIDRFLDGCEVREHTTEPAVIDVGHATPLCFIFYGLLSLFFSSDEQNLFAVFDRFPHRFVGFHDTSTGLL